MAKAKKPATSASTLEIKAGDDEDRDKLLARVALGPGAIPGGERPEAVPDARRDQSRRA